ncbi:hypothetical protein ACVNIS_10515 [Sphaerotilaceae bacterium SBD11-9]
MFRTRVFGAFVCSSVLLLSAHAMAQGAAAAVAKADAPGVRAKAGDLVVKAKVVELDLAQRIITLRRPNGELQSFDVPAEVKNLEAVRVGDDLVLRYAVAAVASLEPTGGKSGIRERVVTSSSAAAASGAAPGAAGRRRVDVLAVIQSIDKKNRKATLRGAKRTITVDVPADIDLKQVKVGDEVRATVIESAVLSFEPAAAAAKK